MINPVEKGVSGAYSEFLEMGKRKQKFRLGVGLSQKKEYDVKKTFIVIKMAAGSVLCRSEKVLSLTCLLVCLLVLQIETSVKSEKYDIYVSKQLRMNDEYHLFNRVSIRPANNFGFKSRAKRYLAGRVQYTAKGTSTF